ncbi:ABC transporter ATP-binding protein [Bacillus coahuilensis m2-6]|uniref:thiol reductant ABC exporter subunit CydC n=1 Tax=Bacillus coahuilensis TaxID=408580 RepID=UPI0001851210|nr:thiol reductant ABC exporter subunit CydC [Bacillus coahuilensis]KUP04829.1 ABC transporter ATP-binding protein [Bacillus coahuilensis m2-6]
MRDVHIMMKLIAREKRDVLLSIACGFVAGITAVGLFSSSGYLISKGALTPPLYTLTVLIALLKLFGIARAVSRYGERYFSHRATFTILSHLRVNFYEKLEPLAPGIFRKYRSGDLLSRIVGDVDSLQNFFLRVYYPPIVLVLVFLSTIFFTTFYSLYLALVLLAGLFLTSFLIPAYFAFRQRGVQELMRIRRGELSTEATELLYGFRELKIYQKLDTKEREVQQLGQSYVKEQEKQSIQSVANQTMNLGVSLLISWTMLLVGAYLVSTGQLNGVFLAMLVMLSLTVFENAVPMAILPIHLEDNRHAANRLYSVVKGEEGVKGTEKLASTAFEFELNHVHYTYPEEEREALSDVTIRLPKGSKTAIVGPSGSGKSTLFQLLLGIIEPTTGTMKINGKNVKDIDRESLWALTNVVLQENHFFHGTLEDNLRIAKENLSPEEMKVALERVNLGHFSLDNRVLEKGGNLSGGEKQRVAIARALLKGESTWLLDEPTSSLDLLTEQKIYHELFHQGEENTVIIISHRLTQLEKMDRIIVMEKGKVKEVGTFSELMEKKGAFYELKQVERTVVGV